MSLTINLLHFIYMTVPHECIHERAYRFNICTFFRINVQILNLRADFFFRIFKERWKRMGHENIWIGKQLITTLYIKKIFLQYASVCQLTSCFLLKQKDISFAKNEEINFLYNKIKRNREYLHSGFLDCGKRKLLYGSSLLSTEGKSLIADINLKKVQKYECIRTFFGE